MDSLQPEQAGNSFGPVDETRWRTTSTIIPVIGVTKKAYAVADGEVFLQPSETLGRVNLFLRNLTAPAFLDTGLAYVVYRDIVRSSLVEVDGFTLRNEPGLTGRAWKGRSSTDPPTIDELITDVEGSSPTEAAVQLAASDRFVPVWAGDPLGDFPTGTSPDDLGSVSIDVVLADPAPRLTPTFLRAPVNELSVDVGQLTGNARWLVESLQRSRILGFMDPCYFFTPLWQARSLSFDGKPPPEVLQWIYTWNNGFRNIFDLRNEHGRPLNFYRDLGSDIDTEPEIRARRADEPPQTDSTREGWPLVRSDEWMGNGEGSVRIQLPLAADPGPAIVQVRGPGIDRIDPVPPGAEAGFTQSVEIEPLRHGASWLPTWFTLHHRRADPTAGGAGAGYRPPDGHRFDALLDRSWLAAAGRPPPHPWVTELRPLVRRTLLERDGAGADPVAVWLGHGVDDHGVYLFARPDRPRLDRVGPVMRSQALQLADDDRLAALLPSLAGQEIQSAGQILKVPAVDPGPDWMVIAVTHAEFAALLAAMGDDPDRSIARLHVLSQPGPAPGIHRFTLGAWSASVTAAGALQTTGPTPLPHGPTFDVRNPDSSILLSSAYLASLATNPEMDRSFIRPDFRLTLRKGPAVEQIGEAAWEAAGRSRFAVADDAHNAFGQTAAGRPIRVSVLGQAQDPLGRRAMLLEILEPVRLIHPADVRSNYVTSVAKGDDPPDEPASPRYLTFPAGLTAWAILTKEVEEGLVRVASLTKFERDLDRLLAGMEEAEPMRSPADHLTHLRMLTQVREVLNEVDELPLVDRVKETILSRMFDVVIGSVEPAGDGRLHATVDSFGRTDPILASTAEPPNVQTVAGFAGVDTTISLLSDYDAVHLGGELIVDLFHIFVGLEVMGDQAQSITLQQADIVYAVQGLEAGIEDTIQTAMEGGIMDLIGDGMVAEIVDEIVDETLIPDAYQPHNLPDRVAASLWIGDVAAVFAKESRHSHSSYEGDWTREHPGELPRDRRTFRLHYYEAAAADIDLVADVLAYRLAPDVSARTRATGSIRQAVVGGFRVLANRLAVEGLRPSAEAFVDRITDDAATADSPDLVDWIERNLVAFAVVFDAAERVKDIWSTITSLDTVKDAVTNQTLPDLPNPFVDPPDLVQDIETAVRVREDIGPLEPAPLAELLIVWIEAVSGRTILDRGDP